MLYIVLYVYSAAYVWCILCVNCAVFVLCMLCVSQNPQYVHLTPYTTSFHNNKKTKRNTTPPLISKAPITRSCTWGLFGCSVDQVKARVLPDLIAEHAEIFMINGDMQSNLYTASRAMHSHILNLLQEGNSSSTAAVRTSVGKLANLQVAVQRRWSNMMTDAIRQQVVEMFLGLKWESHFPTVPMVFPADIPLEVGLFGGVCLPGWDCV